MHTRVIVALSIAGALVVAGGIVAADVVSPVCGTASGTRFNLEPRANAMGQYNQAVDFLPGGGLAGADLIVGAGVDGRWQPPARGSTTGYYVTVDADCTVEFEGALPVITDPTQASRLLYGVGSPVLAVDPVRHTVFIADMRRAVPDGEEASGIAVFRTTRATLRNTTSCPNGTHTAAQGARCWPTKTLVRHPTNVFAEESGPHLAVDERHTGTGSGNVYLVYSDGEWVSCVGCEEAYWLGRVQLVVCKNDLSRCSAPVEIDRDATQPYVSVRPDGRIAVSWISGYDIKYRSCAPAVPPAKPTCSAPVVVHHETQQLMLIVASRSFSSTLPKHAHRIDTNGTETYLLWDRCKTALIVSDFACPEADIVLKASKNDGATWSDLTCVACENQDQFLGAIATDHSRNIVQIAYYTSQDDPFQRRVKVAMKTILPGGATPDPLSAAQFVTAASTDLADPMAPDWWEPHLSQLGLAVRGTGTAGGSRAYLHFRFGTVQGRYHGVRVPDVNNHLSRLEY